MPGFNAVVSPPPPPVGSLGRLRVLSPNAAIRMSALQLGGISLGEAWHEYAPPLTKERAFALLDDFVARGGVSIDTANGYSDEQSEQRIGEWMESRGIRDRMVIATKFTSEFRGWEIGKNEQTNLAGNSRKSLHVSLRESLRKLRTDYIDILYVHWWDHTTSISELMDSLDVVVKQGKVLYLGASDLPAWVTSACNEYAMGKTPFSILQTQWNVLERDIERDILPMARKYQMGVAVFAALGGGKLCPKAKMEERLASGSVKPTDRGPRLLDVLLDIGAAHGLGEAAWAPVALAYLFAKYPLTYPIVGAINAEQLDDNIRALDIALSAEDVRRIEEITPLDIGFPGTMIGVDPHISGKTDGSVNQQGGTIDWLVDTRQYASLLAKDKV